MLITSLNDGRRGQSDILARCCAEILAASCSDAPFVASKLHRSLTLHVEFLTATVDHFCLVERNDHCRCLLSPSPRGVSGIVISSLHAVIVGNLPCLRTSGLCWSA